jgi:hypothetical protein
MNPRGDEHPGGPRLDCFQEIERRAPRMSLELEKVLAEG